MMIEREGAESGTARVGVFESDEISRFVAEVSKLTGAKSPDLMQSDAPVLSQQMLNDPQALKIYFVGLIGGKDVGKSSLVNALVGKQVSGVSGYGRGTEAVTAYCHKAVVAQVRQRLDAQAGGQYSIVEHDVDDLAAQVLLDLPDIDSHYTSHIDLTRRMLSLMLFPIWIQSHEKYADAEAMKLLEQVTQGNAPENLLFCISKADQLVAGHGQAAVQQVCEDYARRIKDRLSLGGPPRVWPISTVKPEMSKLAELRQLLSRQKSEQEVRFARELAVRHRTRMIVQWADRQNLPQRAERLSGLGERVHVAVGERIHEPLMQQIYQLMQDPVYHQAVLDMCLDEHMKRWPLLGVVQSVMSLFTSILRWRSGAQRAGGLGVDGVVSGALEEVGLGSRVCNVFSQLQRSDPEVLRLYRHLKLWEPSVADHWADVLSRQLVDRLSRQSRQVAAQLSGRSANSLMYSFRVLLTVGALVWFPIIQPLVQTLLEGTMQLSVAQLGLGIVKILSVGALLSNVSFLLLWFFILWVLVRYSAQRKIERALERGGRLVADADSHSSADALEVWHRKLLEPITGRIERFQRLIEQLERFRQAAQEPAVQMV